MALSLGSTCIKYLLFIFNLIFVITGVTLLIVGIVYTASFYNFKEFIDGGFFSIPALLLTVGVIIFIVSFFGCCGAFKENYCMTVAFCSCLVLIFVLELGAGIAGYFLRDKAGDFRVDLNKTMDEYNNHSIKAMWDGIQTDLKCCGVDGPKDWLTRLNHTIPLSCCEGDVKVCPADKAYPDGCYSNLAALLKSRAGVFGGIGIGLAIIQLLGIIFSCNLASSIRKDYESV